MVFDLLVFFFNEKATTQISTLSLHDALPIFGDHKQPSRLRHERRGQGTSVALCGRPERSEEHTSELQSHSDVVCRLLLEKKKSGIKPITEERLINLPYSRLSITRECEIVHRK